MNPGVLLIMDFFVREWLGRLAGKVVSSCYDGLLELQLNWRGVLSSVQSLSPRCFGESHF